MVALKRITKDCCFSDAAEISLRGFDRCFGAHNCEGGGEGGADYGEGGADAGAKVRANYYVLIIIIYNGGKRFSPRQAPLYST